MNILLKIDRRFIFLLVAVALIVTTLIGFDVPLKASGTVKAVYNRIETLETKFETRDRPVILVAMDYDPAAAPELAPMTKAMLRHMFRKEHKVVGMTHWPTGLALTKGLLEETVREFDQVVVAYRFVDKAREAKDLAFERQKALAEVKKLPAALRLFGAEPAVAEGTQAPGAIEPEQREAVLEQLAGDAPGREQRLVLAEEGGRRLAQVRERFDALSLEEQAGFLLDAAGMREQVAVIVPGLQQVVAARGAGLTWTDEIHAALALAQPYTAHAVDVGDRWAVLEVLGRVPQLTYGEDYCYLGQKPGLEVLMLAMGQSIYESFPTDTTGKSTRSLPILKDVPTLRQLDYLVTLAAGDTGEKWIQYGHEKYGFPMAVGCTAVMAPDLYPFQQAKQIDGIIGGIRGAWEYEALTGIPGKAYDAVPAQTAAHILVILLIIVCNIGYVLSRKRGEA